MRPYHLFPYHAYFYHGHLLSFGHLFDFDGARTYRCVMSLIGMKCCLTDYAYETNITGLSSLKYDNLLTDYSFVDLNCGEMSAFTGLQVSLDGVCALHGSGAGGVRKSDREGTCPDLSVHVGGGPSPDAWWSARVNRFFGDDEMTSTLSAGAYACVATHRHLTPMSLCC